MTKRGTWAVGAGVAGAALALAASSGVAQKAGGRTAAKATTKPAATSAAPKARYYMDATTMTGMPTGNVMGMLLKRRGAGSTPQHQLELRLGSTLAPGGGVAKADHFMPAGMALGASVPLATPTAGPATPVERESQPPSNVQRPQGRLLLYWGCGAHAGAGQPVVIDFAKVAQGQFPPGLFSVSAPVDRGPTAATSRTYGSWPNDQGKQQLSPQSSLLGAHRVAGNYSPEIGFSLGQDFMPALAVTSAGGPDGSLAYGWSPVTGATGYYAWAVGTQGGGDMVWWSSSARQEFGGGLWDFPAPALVARLVGQGVVLPPAQTGCEMPVEVVRAAGPALIGFLYAYGPQLDFSYPPRPANPKAPWNLEWTAKVRYRSSAMVMPALGAMMRAANGGEKDARPKKCKPNLGGLVGGMFGRKAGAAASAAGAAQGADCR